MTSYSAAGPASRPARQPRITRIGPRLRRCRHPLAGCRRTRARFAIDDLVVDLAPARCRTCSSRPPSGSKAYASTRSSRTPGLLEAHRELELVDHISAAHGRAARLQVLAMTKRRGYCASDGARWFDSLTVYWSWIVGSASAPETRATEAPVDADRACRSPECRGGLGAPVWRDLGTTLAAPTRCA